VSRTLIEFCDKDGMPVAAARFLSLRCSLQHMCISRVSSSKCLIIYRFKYTEDDHSPPSSVEVKNKWSYISIHGVVLN